MQQNRVVILEQKEESAGYNRLRFSWKGTGPEPGQFLTVKSLAPDGTLLRRPFAFSRYNAAQQWAEILYQVRGKATQAYARLQPGESLDAMGPLGRGFSPLPEKEKGTIICLGGGIGTGPVLYAARTAARNGHRVFLILGFRTRALIPFGALPDPEQEQTLGRFHSQVCTDDGSLGIHGPVTAGLVKALQESGSEALIRCCGPLPMMKAVHQLATERGLDCEVSMEEMMACGVGVCNGCAVEMRGSTPENPLYRKACTDGPVFNSREVLWK